jgi:hypothetical protein
MPRDWETHVGITGKAADLLWHGLTANTRQVYHIGQAAFIKFTISNGFHPTFPVQFEALALFIAMTAEKTSPDTMQAYVTHLRSYHIDLGYPTTIFNDEHIKRILRGAARKYGKKQR